MLISEWATPDKVHPDYIQCRKQIIKFVCFSAWTHCYFSFAVWNAVGVLQNWLIVAPTLFLASVVWNGVTEAKSSRGASLSERPEDSWRGGGQPADVPQRSAAPGGGQPPAAHGHSAVQHHAGKCPSVPWINYSNLSRAIQMGMKRENFVSLCIPLFPAVPLGSSPLSFSHLWLHVLAGFDIHDRVNCWFTHQTFISVLSLILLWFL